MKDSESLQRLLADLGPEYELVRELGRGTTAVVYLVIDHGLGREVALKVIRSSFVHDEEALARLQREARLVAQLQHPNIVKLYGTRRLPDGSFVLLMEHVPGRNLKELVRAEGALPLARAVSILRDIASALAYAHRRRIVHRDVKPENIYIDDEVGTARLADFGVARPWDRDTRLTLPGESLGTPAYMSPEQIDNAEVDGRSDVYSLGLVGYELLAGEHPWEGENLYSVIFKQKNEDLPDLAARRAGVPPALVEALARAMRKDPEERWDSAEAFLERLLELEAPGPADRFGSAMGDEPVVFDDPGSPGGAPAGGAAPGRAPEEATGTPRDPGASAAARAAMGGAVGAGAAGWDDRRHGPPSDFGDDDDEFDGRRAVGAVPLPGPAYRKRRSPAVILAVLVLLAAGLGGGWWYLQGRGEPEGTGGPPVLTGAGGAAVGPADPLEPTDAEVGAPAPEAPPATLTLTEDSPLEGMVGDAVPVIVSVVGAAGDPLADVPVRFSTGDGGELVADSVTTGADGTARTVLRLPERIGTVGLVAEVAGHQAEALRVDVRALAGPPATLQVLQGDGQQGMGGQLLTDPLGVRVLDALGNPVGGAQVAFRPAAGGGALEPAQASTDSLGRVFSRWRTGSEGGTQRAEVLVPSVPGVALDFEAEVEAVGAPSDPAADPAVSGVEGAAPGGAGPAVSVVRDAFSVGGTFACRLAGGGEPRCRGANDRGQVRGSAGATFGAVAAGVSHACGLEAGGMASCWGANESGQLGDGSRTDRAIAVPTDSPTRFTRLAAGLAHTCGLDGAGRAWCWGRNLSGQLGDGSRDDRAVPRPVTSDVRLRHLVAGWNHTCGLDGDSRAWCWGLNADGQLGDRSRLDRLTPTRLTGSPAFSALAAGSAHTCGLSGGTVFCWGDNSAGQLGDGTQTDAERPVEAADLPGTATALAAGAVHTCALLDDGRAFCWGQNLHGQLGTGEAGGMRSSPVEVIGDFTFQALEAGGGLTCGITQDGEELCWGLNQSGQLGDGSRTNRARPARVGG